MKRLIALMVSLMLLLGAVNAAAGEGFQECHRVKLTKADTKQENKSVVRVWTADTVLDSVDHDLAEITQAYVDRFAPTLKKAANTTNKNSRLDVEVRYSRTGLSWMSFVIQARTSYHRALVGQEFTTRTYDMTTGQRIYLTDIFAEDSEGWALLEQAIRTRVAE